MSCALPPHLHEDDGHEVEGQRDAEHLHRASKMEEGALVRGPGPYSQDTDQSQQGGAKPGVPQGEGTQGGTGYRLRGGLR